MFIPMKNIRFLILIWLLIISTGIIIYQQTIIQNDKSNFNDKDYEISKLKAELEEIKKENEIYKETYKDDLRSINADVKKCMSKVYKTPDISKCVLNSRNRWNMEIEKNISEIKKLTSPKVAILLDNSQEDWEKYRKSQRELIYKTVWNLQGTMYINISHGLDVDITEQRAKDLDYIRYLIKNGNYIK